MRKFLFLAVMSLSALSLADDMGEEKRFYGAVKVGYAKMENSNSNYDPGVSLGLNLGMTWDENWSLGIDSNYISANNKGPGSDLTLIPVLADFSYAFNNEGVAKWYAGLLAGATGSQISGTSDRWDFTIGAKAGVRFDVNDWLTLAPEIYANNVFLGGNDYQIWGGQALLGMRF